MVWYHDGMFTGRSLIYEYQELTSIDHAVMAIYDVTLPLIERTWIMSCSAAASQHKPEYKQRYGCLA